MRLKFKHFNINNRKFCISACRWLEFTKTYSFTKDGGYKETGNPAISLMHFNLLPVVRYEYTGRTQSLCLEWFFWKIKIENETYLNMGDFL
jgi:hypothetical protein